MGNDGDGLSRLITRKEREIEARWVERVKAEGGDRPGLYSALPEYLQALAQTLSHAHAPEEEAQVWARSAREHAVTRVRRAFDVAAVVRELELLREVLLETAREDGMVADPLFERIVRTLDVPITSTVSSYVDARDYETRRSEAEHIGFLTHELRNPLATAFLAAGQLRRMGLPSPQLQRAAELIERSLGRLRELIEGVMAVEGIEPDGGGHPVETDLGALLTKRLEPAARLARSKGIDLEVEHGGHQHVWLEPERTGNAVMLLVDHAVRYSESGRVLVRVEAEPAAVVIHVWDNCGEVTPEELRSGMALILARREIETQGGTLSAEVDECGCHYRISLPRLRH